MIDVTHRFVETNGIRMHFVEAGHGPLVLLLHGFPESWYSWRHQLTALAHAGYHVVAPDQRGYGQTDRPSQIEQYTQLQCTGDLVGLLADLGEKQAAVVGHDWGATAAWDLALLRPDLVRGVVALSVPYRQRGPVSLVKARESEPDGTFYMIYFQQPGKAEAEMERDVRTSLLKMLYSISGDASAETRAAWSVVPQGREFLEGLSLPETLPSWLTEQDLDYYTSEFERTGFSGGLNWFRAIQKSWEQMAPWMGAPVLPPALYIAGEQDVVVDFPGSRALITNLRATVPHLQKTMLLPGCGHWIQQERPSEVNSALIEFLQTLPFSPGGSGSEI
jgi:pimeloyl-ACP methyl ester carboxylesterase